MYVREWFFTFLMFTLLSFGVRNVMNHASTIRPYIRSVHKGDSTRKPFWICKDNSNEKR